MLHRLLTVFALGLLAFAPPSGRPPLAPLERTEPQVYDVTYEVLISTKMWQLDRGVRGTLNLKDAPIVMPVILNSTYSTIAHETLGAEFFYDTGPTDQIVERLDDGKPFHTHHMVMTIPEYQGKTVRFKIKFRTQAWSSRINERVAQQSRWPREWPDEVSDGLMPQQYIDSDAEIFKQALDSQGGVDALRTVSPYIAAKQIVAYCLSNVQVVGDGKHVRGGGVVEGLELLGAEEAARQGAGSPHDLVCVCVAMLRAAGIPARPVIGVENASGGTEELLSWAEFYLPDAGWVPFDPNDMQGRGVARMDPSRPWREFGTMKDLNERIPLSFHFHPPASVRAPFAALWGWDPRPTPDGQPPYEQAIQIDVVSRGPGRDDLQ